MTSRPWSVDRWGRLLAGCSGLGFAVLALLHHPAWLWGALAVAANLVITSVTDRCALHDLLVRLGAREREDLFYPGGALRMGSAAAMIARGENESASRSGSVAATCRKARRSKVLS